MRAVTTYNRGGHTRFGLGIRGEKEAPSQIDFVFRSSGVVAAPMPAWIEGALETDHVPVCQQLCYVPVNAAERRMLYKRQIEAPRIKNMLPLQWKPRDVEKFQSLVVNCHARTVPEEMERMRVLAAGEQKARPTDTGDYLQTLWRGLRRHRNTVTRRAYHHLIRDEQRKQKRQRESDELDRLLSGQSGGFGTLARRPARLNIPTTLEGDSDQKRWGKHVGDFFQSFTSLLGRMMLRRLTDCGLSFGSLPLKKGGGGPN